MRKRMIILLLAVSAVAVLLLATAGGDTIPDAEVLILMYHDIRSEAVEGNTAVISAETFREQMQTLQDAGFETVTFDDLIAFVDKGVRLPERPVVITFDDGYRSNLELAAPILEEFGMRATINVIGISRGQETYRHTDIPSIPHFSWDEVRPWVERGVIQIGHHSYDMHQFHRLSDEPWRYGVLPMEYESEAAYREALISDFERLRQAILTELGIDVLVFAYPYGRYSELTEAILQELGVRVTLVTHPGLNVLSPGQPESLFLLHRFNMTEETDLEYLFGLFE